MPYELWKCRKPSYIYLKMWGCLAKVVVANPKNIIIGPKTTDCIFIGYANNGSPYWFLVQKFENIPDVHINTIVKSMNAYFFEDIFSCNSSCISSSFKRTCDTAISGHRENIDYRSIQKEDDN